MNIADGIVNTRATAGWVFDGTGSATEVTGSGTSLTVSPNSGRGILIAGSNAVQIGSDLTSDTTFTKTYSIDFAPTGILSKYSVSAWVKPLKIDGPLTILADYTSSTDLTGLFFDGESIAFQVMVGTDAYKVSWVVPDFVECWLATGTLDGDSIHLFINGEEVDSLSLDGNAPTPPASLGAGDSWSSAPQAALLAAPVFYGKPLSVKDAAYLYAAGRDVFTASEIAGRYNGNQWYLSDEERSILRKQEYNSLDAYKSMYVMGSPDISDDGVTVTTETQGFGSVVATVLVPVNCDETSEVKISWTSLGTDFKVSYGDGTIYNELKNGQVVPTTYVTTLGGDGFIVKIEFTQGLNVGTHGIADLEITEYSNKVIQGSDITRELTIAGIGVATFEDNNEPIEHSDYAGAWIYNAGGSLSLAPDISETPEDTKAYELWVNWSGSAGELYNDTVAIVSVSTTGAISTNGATATINGGAQSVLTKGEFCHVYISLSSANNQLATIGGQGFTGKIGMLSTYIDDVDDVEALYNLYFDKTAASVNDAAEVVTVTDPAEITMNDSVWSINQSSLS